MDLYDQLEIPDEDRLTSIRKDEAEYLYRFLKEKNISRTLEIGFAYGCSTAYIISATRSIHIAIDPYEESYNNIGLKNIQKLGFSEYLRHITEPSHIALPELVKENLKLDFVFIDGGHKYDDIFLDWYYADILLEEDGYVFIDDSWMRSTQMVAAFITTNRSDYKLLTTPIDNLIAFQKIGIDNRKWDHFEEFCP